MTIVTTVFPITGQTNSIFTNILRGALALAMQIADNQLLKPHTLLI